jgi:hypothetical protein
VFGVELIRMGYLVIAADDGSTPYLALPARNVDWSGSHPRLDTPPAVGAPTNGERRHRETIPGIPAPVAAVAEATQPAPERPDSVTPQLPEQKTTQPLAATSGEIIVKPKTPAAVPAPTSAPPRRISQPIAVPHSPDEITHPVIDQRLLTPVPGSVRPPNATPDPTPNLTPNPVAPEPRGSILGIGMSSIGQAAVSGEIPSKVPPGGRVLVPGPNGLMQSATVRQLLQGYYELEVGSSGQTIWVPINGVVRE